MMIEMNSHLIRYTDKDRGPAMISVRRIEAVYQDFDWAMIETGSLYPIYATESAQEIIDRIDRIQALELYELSEQ